MVDDVVPPPPAPALIGHSESLTDNDIHAAEWETDHPLHRRNAQCIGKLMTITVDEGDVFETALTDADVRELFG